MLYRNKTMFGKIGGGILVLVIAVLGGNPARAAGPYIVDDANIVARGMVQNEFWYTHTNKGGDTGTADMAYQIYPDLEFTLQGTRDSETAGQSATLAPQLKYVWHDEGKGGAIKSAVVLGADYTFDEVHSHGFDTYIPTTFRLSDTFVMNADLGWQYIVQGGQNFATWGVGGIFDVTKHLSATASIFGRNDHGPGVQTGPQWKLSEGVWLEFVYGYNVVDQHEHSATLGAVLDY